LRSARYCTITAPSVSTCPSSSRNVGTYFFGLISVKFAPLAVFCAFVSTRSTSNGSPSSRSTMCGESEQAPGLK
jgi:hypothetical protein